MSNTIAFIGAGNMASALIGGMIANGYPAEKIIATDLSEERLAALKNEHGIQTSTDNAQTVLNADCVVLAVKPQVLKEVATAIAPQVQEKTPLLVSIAAGIRSDDLERWLGGNVSLVRSMPNTPALLQTGATGLFANSQVNDNQKELAESLMNAVGITLWVDNESQIDAVTAVSGSGPAYFFLVMEAMSAAGEKLGLSSEIAKKLTLQTALGAARMATEGSDAPDELRKKVTSPGGTTEQAINSFENSGIREIFEQALNAADTRSKELSEILGKD